MKKNTQLFYLLIFTMSLVLSSCSDPKPGQYPPSQYGEREEKSKDIESNPVKKELNGKKSSDSETKATVNNSSTVNDAPQRSQQQPATKTTESVDPSNSAINDSAKSDEKVTEEIAEKTFPQDSLINQPAKSHSETQERAIDKSNSSITSGTTLKNSDKEIANQTIDIIDPDAQKKEMDENNSSQLKTNGADVQHELNGVDQENPNTQSVTESVDPIDPTQSSKANSVKSDEEAKEEISEQGFPQDKTSNLSNESTSATKGNAVQDTSDKNLQTTLEDDTDEEVTDRTDDSDEDDSDSDTGFAEKREKQ